jgi:hypothetical protein
VGCGQSWRHALQPRRAALLDFGWGISAYRRSANANIKSLASTSDAGTDTGDDNLFEILQRALVERNK